MTKPTVPEVLPLVDAYYAIDGNGAGGSLHIVLEDSNLLNSHVEWCIDHAHMYEDHRGVALARVLLRMSRTQRGKLAGRHRYQWESGITDGAELFDRLLSDLT